MLEEKFEKMYLLFRASYYRRMVEAIGAQEGSLSATESYCVEVIYLLGNPTMSEFARFLGISVPNANYKVSSMVEKGYLTKAPSPGDRREQRLQVTSKFLDYYALNNEDNARLMRLIRSRFSAQEVDELERTIEKIIQLMGESE